MPDRSGAPAQPDAAKHDRSRDNSHRVRSRNRRMTPEREWRRDDVLVESRYKQIPMTPSLKHTESTHAPEVAVGVPAHNEGLRRSPITRLASRSSHRQRIIEAMTPSPRCVSAASQDRSRHHPCLGFMERVLSSLAAGGRRHRTLAQARGLPTANVAEPEADSAVHEEASKPGA